MGQIKLLLPTIQIPDFENKSEEEKKAMLAIYIMQFGNLNYQITLKALNNITKDDKKMEKFSKAPIPTLARESVGLTEFEKHEKEKYKNEQTIRYCVDIRREKMLAINMYGRHIPEMDRNMTAIEYDYWIADKMTTKEYDYWKGLTEEKPWKDTMQKHFYNPKTREQNYIPMLDGFEPIGAGNEE